MERNTEGMQEIVQGERRYNVRYEFDPELVKRVSKKCGSAAVKSAPSFLSTLKHWSGKQFWGFTVDGVAFCYGAFAKKHFRLAEIAVEEEHQSAGYGRFMMSVLMAECAKRNIHRITLRTSMEETAYEWYLKQGAQIVGLNKNDYEMEFVI